MELNISQNTCHVKNFYSEQREEKEEPNMDQVKQQLPQIEHFIRKLDTFGSLLIVYKDWLYSTGGSSGVIKQWNCEGQCIRTLESRTGTILYLFGRGDYLYSGS